MERTTALVTGGTGGIGFHIAAGLASGGARVLVSGRDADRGRAAVEKLRHRAGHERVELVLADASTVAGNHALADEVARRTDRLEVLVNNVGGLSVDRTETPEGLESTLSLCFVGPFALTGRLLPLLRAAGSARVVQVVSSAFTMWRRDPLEDLDRHGAYPPIEAYAHAKLLGLLFAMGLARREAGSELLANAVNPGMAWTPGTEALTPRAVPAWRFVWPVVRWFQRRASAETAAQGPLFLASSPDAGFSGRYLDGLKEGRLPATLLDPALHDRVWKAGEALVAQAMGR